MQPDFETGLVVGSIITGVVFIVGIFAFREGRAKAKPEGSASRSGSASAAVEVVAPNFCSNCGAKEWWFLSRFDGTARIQCKTCGQVISVNEARKQGAEVNHGVLPRAVQLPVSGPAVGSVRILTNGIRFKIQERMKRRFLWRTWEEWRDLGRLVAPHPTAWFVTYYDKYEDAKKVADEMNRCAAALHEWCEPTAGDTPQRVSSGGS